MIYAASDLHGYPLDGFLRLLDNAHFSDADFLFVLGDAVDRNGDGGVAMLEWMMLQPNVQFILGNHEAMLLSCDFLFQEITEDLVKRLDMDQIGRVMNWMRNGAEPTLNALHALRKRDPEALIALLDYLRDAPLYDSVTAGGRDFLLVHSGLGGFRKDKPLSAYEPDDLLWHRPSLDECYFDDVLTVLGHTPTAYYGAPGRMLQTPTWIDIDIGAGSGYPPMLLRLDDLRPFYQGA